MSLTNRQTAVQPWASSAVSLSRRASMNCKGRRRSSGTKWAALPNEKSPCPPKRTTAEQHAALHRADLESCECWVRPPAHAPARAPRRLPPPPGAAGTPARTAARCTPQRGSPGAPLQGTPARGGTSRRQSASCASGGDSRGRQRRTAAREAVSSRVGAAEAAGVWARALACRSGTGQALDRWAGPRRPEALATTTACDAGARSGRCVAFAML